MKSLTKPFLALLFLSSVIHAGAQTTGTVFRDYNGNGTRQTAAPTIEPLVTGIFVNAYNSSDVLIASFATTSAAAPNYSIPTSGAAYNGTPGSNTGFIGSGVAVRLEFIITTSCNLNPNIDYSTGNGPTVGSSVRFVSGGATGVNYAIQNPADYISTINPTIYVPVFTNGNPLGGGTTGTSIALAGFTYTSTGITAPATALTQSQIGTVWGLAYSKSASRLFASAFLKRQNGLGPGNGSPGTQPYVGTIYLVNPSGSSASFYCDLDALGFPTHAASGALNVRTNAARALGANLNSVFQDPTTFDQVGKVGIGDIDISDDGRYLYVMNLFDRKLYRIDLQNPANPQTPTAAQITSWSVPNPNPGGANPAGEHRPFALKVYRGKVYVGMVTSGQNAAGTPAANNASMNAYVYEFDPAASGGSGAFNGTALLTVPLNYTKGIVTFSPGCDIAAFANWHPWVSTNPAACAANNRSSYPQPILSDIEFDDQDGSMIIAFIDRYGHQMQRDNNGPADAFTDWNVRSGGDILRAYKNAGCTNWIIENNGDKDGPGPYVAIAAQQNSQGPGGGEFYYLDNWFNPGTERHQEIVLGGLLLLPGSQEIMSTVYDPIAGNAFTEGVKRFSNNTGAIINNYQVVDDLPGFGAKGNGLGDIEMVQENPPIELGNRIWNDTNGNGIQDANETGLGGVEIELVNGGGTVIATVISAPDGSYYFSSATGTSTTGITYGVNILPKTNYTIRVKGTTTPSNTITGNAGLTGSNYFTNTGAIGNGQPGLSDNDAANVGGVGGRYQASITTGSYGQNNHNIDIGFTIFNILPVKLISFTAQPQSSQVVLTWKVTEQLNINSYSVEHSTNGSVFTTIQTVTANTNTDATYNATHANPANGINYYRIRIVSVDGTVKYSEVRIVIFNGKGTLSIFPNPANDKVNIQLPESWQRKDLSIKIINQLGQVIIDKQSENASQVETINVSNLPSGIYTVRIANADGASESRKLKIYK